MQRTTIALTLTAMLAGGLVVHADKGKRKQVRYAGIHPIGKGHGKGICHIEAPHVHIYDAPAAKLQFRQDDDTYVFVGDPVAYGWDGPRHAYVGHHPVWLEAGLGAGPGEHHCYLDGPHFHAFEPPLAAKLTFEVKGDAHYYVGTPAPAYIEARPAMVEVNAVYKPLEYARPVVTVEPPTAWIGLRVDAPVVVVPSAVVVAPGVRGSVDVVVPAPSLSVEVQVPSIEIGIGGGVVIDGGHGHKHKRGKRGKGHRKHDD